jgi:hypothetical protein
MENLKKLAKQLSNEYKINQKRPRVVVITNSENPVIISVSTF